MSVMTQLKSALMSSVSQQAFAYFTLAQKGARSRATLKQRWIYCGVWQIKCHEGSKRNK
jgi:hypothetical protein